MQIALDLTWKTLTARMRNYRLGSFSCLGLAFMLILLLVFTPTWWLLASIPLFLVIGYGFVIRDHYLVFTWENGVLNQWDKPDFVMGIFTQAIANHHQALRGSIKSMLAILPADPDYLPPTPEKIRLFRTLCWTRKATQDIRLSRSAMINFSLATLPVLILAFFKIGNQHQVFWFLPLAGFPMALAFLYWKSWTTWKNRISSLGPVGLEEWEQNLRQLKKIDWRQIPTPMVKHFLAYPRSKE
jgi:hypothetical protein